jgi:DNA polymerase-4
MFEAARPLLQREADGRTQIRLIGVGISHLSALDEGSAASGLDARAASQARAEMAMDRLRDKFGLGTIGKGRSLKPPGERGGN